MSENKDIGLGGQGRASNAAACVTLARAGVSEFARRRVDPCSVGGKVSTGLAHLEFSKIGETAPPDPADAIIPTDAITPTTERRFTA
jgi:hypothetical protein